MASREESARRRASRRREVLASARDRRKVDWMLVTLPEDVSYLSGFTGDDSVLLVGPGDEAVLITDGRYDEQAGRQCRDMEVAVRDGAMSKAVSAAIEDRKIRKLAFQAGHVTVEMRDAIAEKISGSRKLIGLTGVCAAVRATKDAEEIRAIGKAIWVAQKAFRELTAGGRDSFIGRSEAEIAADLDYRMRRMGASGPAFETIVATGRHGSLPHYRPDKTKIRPDQAVLIDWGAMVDGYCSDLTRVVFTGTIPPKIAEIYAVVLRAQKDAISAVRSGVCGKTVDAAAREVIDQAGYGGQFVHGLGHGIGRQIHEAPSMGRHADKRLRSGMVVTVEPGIYLPGLGGVRIEDDVLVEPRGQRKLSSLPRSAKAMVLR